VEGVKQAILQFIDRLADPGGPHESRAEIFRRLGRVAVSEECSLNSLQTAYRIGARVAWRRMSERGRALGIPADTLCLLAEAVFAYIDEISALSIEGYAAVRTRAAGALERRRKRLLELITSEPGASPRTVAELAKAAQWELPDQVVVVALEAKGERLDFVPPSLDPAVLVDYEGNEPCLVTGDPDRHLLDLGVRLQGWRAAVGPSVRLADAPVSLRWARRTIGLVRRNVLPDRPVTWCRDHLSTLWLSSEEFLAHQLACRSLAPLRTLTPKQRARLSATLLAWLDTHGGAPDVANRLGVHPQTVRYRLHQIENLFGARLNDPDSRFDMEVALRALRLLGGNQAIPT
jgi:hypothetical protein